MSTATASSLARDVFVASFFKDGINNALVAVVLPRADVPHQVGHAGHQLLEVHLIGLVCGKQLDRSFLKEPVELKSSTFPMSLTHAKPECSEKASNVGEEHLVSHFLRNETLFHHEENVVYSH